MTKALGPVWHKKQKELNIVPAGLTGLDKQATWSFSKTDGWVYGHGSYCESSHEIPFLLTFKWMPNSGNESKVMLNMGTTQSPIPSASILLNLMVDGPIDLKSFSATFQVKGNGEITVL